MPTLGSAREELIGAGEVVFRTGYDQSVCGDTKIEDYETCDDGLVAAGDGCGANCLVEPGFYCAGVPSVCVTACGDGVVAGAEGCDDGAQVDGDGCSAQCVVQDGFQCLGTPSVCSAVCGDGKIVGAEQCDDGGLNEGDGCSASCAIEYGFYCAGTPSTCATACGDGKPAGAETCDDGGTADLDGCSASCAVESPFQCTGTPSTCKVPGCDAVPLPPAPGFTRAAVPSTWTQLTGGSQFPASNVSSPLRLVPAYPPAGLVFLGASAGQWASVRFTTPVAPFAGDLSFGDSQIPGTVASQLGSYSLTVTRCPADFRPSVPDPQVSTDFGACRSVRFSQQLGTVSVEAIHYDSSGVSGDGFSNNICGLAPNETYFLNYINADVQDGVSAGENECPNNASNCGVQFKSN